LAPPNACWQRRFRLFTPGEDLSTMRHVAVVAFVAAGLVAACVALSASNLAAEPISSADSLQDPWKTTSKTQDLFEVQTRFDARDYEGALAILKRSVKSSPDMPPAQVIMAQLFLRANMPTEANKALEQAIVDAPGDPEPYMTLASVAMSAHDMEKAESLFQKAFILLMTFDKSDKRKESLQQRISSGSAELAEARKDWPRAQKALESWLKSDPNNAGALQRIANCLLRQNNVDGALQRLRQAAKADTALPAPEAMLGQLYERAGDRQIAKKWMADALTAAPKDLKTRLAVTKWALETGQLDEAQKQAVAAMRIDPKSTDAEFLRGATAMFQKDYRAAELVLDSAMARSPGNAPISNGLAIALVEQDDAAKKQRALEIAQGNARRFPKSVVAASTYGWVLYRLGRLDDAEKALAAAAAGTSDNADTAFIVATVSDARGRKAEAKKLLETALAGSHAFLFRQEAEELLQQLKK
jgi:tetratricopeptide (TPR) repeat protein